MDKDECEYTDPDNGATCQNFYDPGCDDATCGAYYCWACNACESCSD